MNELDYKRTELGNTPKEWYLKEIKELAAQNIKNSFIDGDWVESKYIEDKGIRLIQTGNIGVGYFKEKNSKKYISEKTYEILDCKQVLAGDILICRLADPIGRACIAPSLKQKMITSVDVVILRPNEQDYNSLFINYSLNFTKTLQRVSAFSSGTTRQRISRKNLGSIRLAVPPLEEQQKIAAILSSVDEAIEKTEQIVEQTEKVKKGLMQQLLTKGVGHTEFKKTAIGKIPEKWDYCPLSEVLSVQGGYAFQSKDAKDTGIKWLKIANVGIGEVLWNDISYLPSDFKATHSEYELKESDIIMAMTRPVIRRNAKVAKVSREDTPSLLNQRVGRFLINGCLYKNYFYQFARSGYFATEILLKIAGTDPPNISAKQIESIMIPIPGLEEQEKISKILTLYDQKIKNGEHKLEKLYNVKQGLMQQLLTGKVRVPIENDEVV